MIDFLVTACGEPALVLAISVPFALRDALQSARKDSNDSDNTFLSIGKLHANIYNTFLLPKYPIVN